MTMERKEPMARLRQLTHAGIAVTLAATIAFATDHAEAQGKAPIVVPEKWIERKCLDYGNRDLGVLSEAEFEACIRKMVSGYPKLDPSRRELFGELYDPEKYVKCRVRQYGTNTSSCDVHILRRREWPEYWPEGAKRIKWPDAPKESVYRKGMKPKEYWEALCKAEAGEFIYKTVKDVEGFLWIRPRGQETDYAMQDKYAIEDAYGLHEFAFGDDDARPGKRIFRLDESNYRAIESPIGDPRTRSWVRQSLDIDRLKALHRTQAVRWSETDFTNISQVSQPQSIYGVTWRGIRRPGDLDLGVSGGELAIVNLRSGEILGLRRGFALDAFAARGIMNRHSWLGSWGCPVMAREPKDLREFVKKVLEPIATSK
jgi:hypothetical protein